MAPTTATLALAAWRNDDVFEVPIRVVGLDLTGMALAMQIRLGRDVPGAALVDLAKVDNGNAQGLRVAGVTIVEGVPVSDLRIRINKTTLRDLPYSGEVGDNALLAYALLIGGKTRLTGLFEVLAHAYGSDVAPTNRPDGYASASSGAASGGATLTVSSDGAVTLKVDGADLAGAERVKAEAAAAAAQAARTEAQGLATITATGGALAISRRRAQPGAAVLVNDAVGPVGVTIPAGQTGAGSLIQPGLPIDGTTLVGTTQRMTLVARRETAMARPLVFGGIVSIVRADGSMVNRGANSTEVTIGAVTTWTIDFVVEATDRFAFVFAQTGAGSAATAEERWRVVDVRRQSVAASDRNVGDQAAALIDAAAPAGDLAPPRRTAVQVFNGAVKITRADGVDVGFTMPVATPGNPTSGFQSLVQVYQDIDPAQAGAAVEVEIVAEISAPYTRAPAHYVELQLTTGASVALAVDELRFVQSGARLTWTFFCVLPANAATIVATMQQGADQSPAAAEFLRVSSVALRYVTSADPTRNPAEVNRAVFGARLLAETAGMIAAGIRPTLVTVKADGSGDFAHPADAVAAIADASAIKPYVVLIHPGRYTGQGNWLTKDYVDLVGTDRATCIIHWEQPNDVSGAALGQSQIFYLNSRTRVANLTLTGRNVRYVVHLDDNNGRNVNSRVVIENVTMIHFGNDQAVNADPSAALVPFGCGTNSGTELLLDNVDATGPAGGGLGFHNNLGSTAESKVIIRNCRSVSLQSGRAPVVTSLGSRRADRLSIEGSDLGTGLAVTLPAWPAVPPSDQPADRYEVDITGAGNQPFAFRIVANNARALRITSADASAATLVEVDPQTAGPLIFRTVRVKRGGVGLAAAVYSWFDVSGEVAGTSLGQRLGDCSVAPKSFRVRFQGGAWKAVNFTTDLRNASNADVLAIINAALGAAGTADLWTVTADTRRPTIRDEERSMRNAGVSAILRRAALAYDGGRDRVRLMTSADPLKLFAGIAWEDILPGSAGRVKTRGLLPLEDLNVAGQDALGTGLVFGDSFGIDAGQAGRLVKNGGGLLEVTEPAYPALSISATHAVR